MNPKKYKFLVAVEGVEYGQEGNNPVLYNAGDVVYGISYGDSDIIWVNKTGIFDNIKPTLGVTMNNLQETEEEVGTTPAPINNDTQKDTNTFWDEGVTLQKRRLYGIVVFSFLAGYVLGWYFYKK